MSGMQWQICLSFSGPIVDIVFFHALAQICRDLLTRQKPRLLKKKKQGELAVNLVKKASKIDNDNNVWIFYESSRASGFVMNDN